MSNIVGTASRNLAASFASFVFLVAIDFLEIKQPDFSFLSVIPTLLLYGVVPAAFWFANIDRFRERPNGTVLRALLALGLSILFGALAFIPFPLVHSAIGGKM